MAKYKGQRAHYMGAWSYFFLNILYAIPVVGLIFLIVHACMPSHENRCHYARSFFCALLVLLIFAAIGAAIALIGGADITSNFEEVGDALKEWFEKLKSTIK